MKIYNPGSTSAVPYNKLLPVENDALNPMEHLDADFFLSLDDKRDLVEASASKKRSKIWYLAWATLLLLVVLGGLSIGFVLLKAHIIDLPSSSWASKKKAAPLVVHPSLPPLPTDPRRLTKCPPADLFKCDGRAKYSTDALRAHQFRIDEALSEELLEGANKLPIFYNLPVSHNIRMAFKKCTASDSRTNQSQLVLHTLSSAQEQFGYYSSFFNRKGHSSFRAKPFSPANFSRLIGHLQTSLGMSTLIHMNVQASESVQQPFAIYLKINHESMHKSDFIQEFIIRNSKGVFVRQSLDIVLRAITDLKNTCIAVSYPLEYEKWTLRSINHRWSELDLPQYFRLLASAVKPELKELLEDGELEFFVQNPDCFTALNDLLRSQGVFDRHTFVANLMIYLSLAQKSEFLSDFDLNESVELAEKTFPLKDVPYRLKCVAELRQNVPHFMGKLYWEVLENRERHKENVTALKSSFHVYYRSLMKTFMEFVGKTKGFKQAFALEKLRNVGVTHGAPDWLKNSKKVQLAHHTISMPSIDGYFGTQIELQRFAFFQQLYQLVEEDEYNRQRPFAKLCSATVQVSYSRAGNWLQIPLAILTLPQFKLDKLAAFKYTNLFKYSTLGRQLVSEVSKAVDSDGKWWFANGLFRSVDMFGPSFSLKNTEECYRDQLSRSVQEGDTDKHIQQAIKDIFGITVSMTNLKQQYLKETGDMNARLVLERYFTELQPYFCSLAHQSTNSNNNYIINEHQLILKDSLQSLMVDNRLFGCITKHLTFNQCEIQFDEDDTLGLPDGALYEEEDY